MKTFQKITAWTGLVIVAIGATISFWNSSIIAADPNWIGIDYGHMFALLLSIIGLLFMLIGGLLSRPKHLWLASIIVGCFYIISFFSMYQYWPTRIDDNQIGSLLSDIAISFLPGLVAIIEGIWLKVTAK